MLKVTTAVSKGGVLTMGIAGRLTRDGCDTIDGLLRDARKQYREVNIDLAGIRLVDQHSIEYLSRTQSCGITLINVPSYVSRWIEQVSKQPESGNVGGQSY
jgi:hypothetical protein